MRRCRKLNHALSMFQIMPNQLYTFGVRKPCLRSGRKHGLRTPKIAKL